MKIVILAVFFTGLLPFISCQKELSCENCAGNNKPPIANSGPDQIIVLPKDSVTLDGSASSDADGTITSYKWIKISGPASSNLINPSTAKTSVKTLVAGVYQFELTVTDNGGLSAKDTMKIMVDAPGNQPPVACAGADQTITLPTNSVTLNGSCSADPDNNITSYAWTKVSGPSSFNIANANSVQTQVTNLIQGIYQFELKVTDAGSLSSKDTVQVTVNPGTASNTCDNSNRPKIITRLIPIGTLSQARSGIAVASAGNKIVFAGAVLSPSNTPQAVNYGSSRVDIYDIATKTWSTAELSEWRQDIAAVAAGNKLFFAGGRLGDGAFDLLFSTVDIYDASTNTWSVASLSEPRAYVAAATVGNKVFFAGGEKDWAYNGSSRVDVYDLSTNKWSTTSLSEPRKGINAITVNDKIYFAGGAGQWQWFNDVSDKIDIYNNTTNTWSTAKLIEPKGFFAGLAVGNTIYWGGGVNGTSSWGSSCKVEIRDLNTQTSAAAYLSEPSHWWTSGSSKGAALKDNKIIFFGGNEDPDKFDIYDIATNTWSIGILPFAIKQASIISVNNIIYLAGGLVNGGLSDKVWKLEF